MHFSKFVFGLGNGMNLAPFSLSGYRLSDLQVPNEQCFTIFLSYGQTHLYYLRLIARRVLVYVFKTMADVRGLSEARELVGGAYFSIHLKKKTLES